MLHTSLKKSIYCLKAKSNKKCVLFIVISIKAKSVVIVNVVSLEEESRRTEWKESERV